MEPGNRPQVADPAEDDRGSGRRQLTDQMIQVHLEPFAGDTADHVIGPHRNQDQVRVELEGRADLTLNQVVGARSPDRQGLEDDMVVGGEPLTDQGNPHLLGTGDTRRRDRGVTENHHPKLGQCRVAERGRRVELGEGRGGPEHRVGSLQTDDDRACNRSTLDQMASHGVILPDGRINCRMRFGYVP